MIKEKIIIINLFVHSVNRKIKSYFFPVNERVINDISIFKFINSKYLAFPASENDIKILFLFY